MSALSTTARREYYSEIGNALPPPVLHNQEYHDRRHTAAVEAFEALRPGDADEARLAVNIVLTGAHAAESLREAGVYREDYAKRTHCRAQAASLMREQRAFRRTLAQEQKMRLATEAVANAAGAQPAAASALPPQAERQAPPPRIQAASVAPEIHPATVLPEAVQAPAEAREPVQAAAVAPQPVQAAAVAPESAHAVSGAPEPIETAVPEPVQAHTEAPQTDQAAPVAPPRVLTESVSAPPPAPVPPVVAPLRPAASGSTAPHLAGACSASPPSLEAIARAEAYAAENLVAAAQIRHDRGITPQSTAYFRHLTLPADPALIDALVRGSSDTLTLLDEIGGETFGAAA